MEINSKRNGLSFNDGTELLFDKGKFDDFCVYEINNGKRHAPTDSEYFQELLTLADKLTSADNNALLDENRQFIYGQFCKLYENTHSDIQDEIICIINQISNDLTDKLNDDTCMVDIQKTFSKLYLTMIAENNRAYTKLGKRIKRLGVYQVLLENSNITTACNFSKGKKWPELATLCEKYGF